MRAPAVHAVAHPIVSWTLFIVTLWAIHFSGFFEAALEHETIHQLEHAIYLSTALFFWLPVIAIGPTPWVDGPLAFPIRMVYLLVAMPAEGFLGFAIYGSRRMLYAHYAGAGLADQQTAGELMWIGSGLAMFVAFMAVGFEWAQHEERRSLREETRRVRDASFA
jgi:putative copper resistance protein D